MAEEQVHHRKKKILAVDDDGLVRKSIGIFLKDAGYEPTVAASGPEALRFLAERHYDLVITDIRMPGMDGLQVIQAVRDYCQQMKKPSIPMIVLTAYNDEPVRLSTEKMGVREFVFKPFKLEDFVKVLERQLGPR
ncbi:MAG TPA: response regulator [Candidatus Omnitrophota bacterium]|nr:response regulator [Candidatus Omnitrophota bacterium]